VFVSLHNNSVPDGTDPRTKSGTSTFYYHPQSLALAQSVQKAMLERLGLPDLGVNQKSLFVCRMTECPSILVEPTFIILPDHEKLLLTTPGQQKIAQGIFEGIRGFFEAK
jgi:N-acetylmuramoyl-L-alanine amidase